MTNDKIAEHEKLTVEDERLFLAMEIVKRIANIGNRLDIAKIQREQCNDIAKALADSYAAGRREAIAEVLPVLEFYADDDNWLGADPDEKYVESFGYLYSKVFDDDGQQARALLERLKPA